MECFEFNFSLFIFKKSPPQITLFLSDVTGTCPPGWELNKCGDHCQDTCKDYLTTAMRPCLEYCGPAACVCRRGLVVFRDRCVDPLECHVLITGVVCVCTHVCVWGGVGVVCVHVCVFCVCVCVCVQAFVHVCMHVFLHVCVFVCAFVCACALSCMCACMCGACVCVCMCVRLHACVHACVYPLDVWGCAVEPFWVKFRFSIKCWDNSLSNARNPILSIVSYVCMQYCMHTYVLYAYICIVCIHMYCMHTYVCMQYCKSLKALLRLRVEQYKVFHHDLCL